MAAPVSTPPHAAKGESIKVAMKVNNQVYKVVLNDNPAAAAFAERLPLTLKMAELNGNEKFAGLAHPLPTQEVRAGTIHAGDIMLYGPQTLVLFYQRFSSNYRYTPLGKVVLPAALEQAVGHQETEVEFYRE